MKSTMPILLFGERLFLFYPFTPAFMQAKPLVKKESFGKR
jgi:hypothetical protein